MLDTTPSFPSVKSGLLKRSGGGIATFDFMVRIFDGAREKSLVWSLMVSTVNGREFSIPSVSPLVSARILSQVILHVLKVGMTV